MKIDTKYERSAYDINNKYNKKEDHKRNKELKSK